MVLMKVPKVRKLIILATLEPANYSVHKIGMLAPCSCFGYNSKEISDVIL